MLSLSYPERATYARYMRFINITLRNLRGFSFFFFGESEDCLEFVHCYIGNKK